MASTYTAAKLASSPCAWRWDATSRIRQALGFSSTKVPATFHGTFKVDGWTIVIKRGKAGAAQKSAAHRIYVDHGGRLVPAGRVRQALCARTLHKSRKSAAKRRGPKGLFVYR